MGNDNSKNTIENQQLIMQLQQQLLQEKQNQYAQNQYIQQNQNAHSPQLFSPAEIQRGINPNNPMYQSRSQSRNQSRSQSREHDSGGMKASQGNKLLEILGNKELMSQIDKNPTQKRKLLEKLLNEHRYMMTSNQVSRITQMLNNLPPADNNSDTSRFAFQNLHEIGKQANGNQSNANQSNANQLHD